MSELTEDTNRKSSFVDEDDTLEEQQRTNEEVSALIGAVKQSLSSLEVETNDGDDQEEKLQEEMESKDKVKLTEHLNMTGLTLDARDEASSSRSCSAGNSASSTPAVLPSGADTTGAANATLQNVPPVELKDGGNAFLETPAASRNTPTFDVRVAVVGNVDAGKSTLIGVLTGGALDDGRGKARSKVFIHQHELSTGRTSAISSHLMGFDHDGKPVHQSVAASAQSAAKTKSWSAVLAASRNTVTFVDLAGHEKYLNVTLSGLTGSHPDYAIVLVNSLAGVTKMTKEHLGVVLALEIPLICVVTKVDQCPQPVLEQSKKQLFRILKSSAANKMPIQMRSEKDIETVISNSENSNKICPVFFVSSVTGVHINLLLSYLSRLRPRLEWLQRYAEQSLLKNPSDSANVKAIQSTAQASSVHANHAVEFSIDEVFNVSGVGIVVSGTLASGVLTVDSTLMLGPFSDASFVQVLVRSLHYKRVSTDHVEAGQSCAIAIRAVKRKETLKRNLIRRGMVLVDPVVDPRSTRLFDAEVLVLHHSSTIKPGYQAVLHIGMIKQTAQIFAISKDSLRTGDKSVCRFRFIQREEYMHVGDTFVFREGSTKGVGKVIRVRFSPEEVEQIEENERLRRKFGNRAPPAGAAAAAPKSDEESAEINSSDPSHTISALSGTSSSTAAVTSATPAAAAAAAAPASAAKEKEERNKDSKWTQSEKDEFHAKHNKKK